MAKQKKKRFPWFTLILSLVCVAFFSLFQYYISIDTSEGNVFSKIGAPFAVQIYQGQFWGIVTNSFVHVHLIHLLLNLLGLWLLLAYLERRVNFFFLIALGFFASSITSMFQLAVSDDAGIGLSGVNYFLLLFIIGKSIKNDKFKLKYRYIYFAVLIIALGISAYLNYNNHYKIGIESMATGLLLGLLIGFLSEVKRPYISVAAVMLVLISTGVYTLLHAPWSAEWNYSKGLEYQLKYEFTEAKKYYGKAVELDPEHSSSKSNLFIIKIEELSDLAMIAHEEEDYVLAGEYYQKILLLDPSNNWARENIAKLP